MVSTHVPGKDKTRPEALIAAMVVSTISQNRAFSFWQELDVLKSDTHSRAPFSSFLVKAPRVPRMEASGRHCPYPLEQHAEMIPGLDVSVVPCRRC